MNVSLTVASLSFPSVLPSFLLSPAPWFSSSRVLLLSCRLPFCWRSCFTSFSLLCLSGPVTKAHGISQRLVDKCITCSAPHRTFHSLFSPTRPPSPAPPPPPRTPAGVNYESTTKLSDLRRFHVFSLGETRALEFK